MHHISRSRQASVPRKLSWKVKALQDNFKDAHDAYENFKDRLMEDTIKPLETNPRIVNGGKCHICRLLGS